MDNDRSVNHAPIYRFRLALWQPHKHIHPSMGSGTIEPGLNDPAMQIPWELLAATFINRPNRFVTQIRLDGEVLRAHLPDPGRLKELLLPGVALRVQHTPGPKRKTDYTTHLVQRGNVWICINTLLPNRFTDFLINGGHLPFLSGWTVERREVKEGASRFDFLLAKGAERMFLEVKSVTYAEDGLAQFPDAVTERGARHARHLAELARQGQRTMILFVIQRDDADRFRPMWDRDPALGHALVAARKAGVAVHAIRTAVSPETFAYRGEVPIDLSPPAG